MISAFFLGVCIFVPPPRSQVSLLAVDLEHTDLRLPYAWTPSGQGWLILHA